jgi:tetratricopeptide (TPR) repeat protein
MKPFFVLILLVYLSTQSLCKTDDEIRFQIDSLNQQSKHLQKTNFSSAKLCAKQALKLSKKVDYSVGEVSSVINLAECYQYLGKLDTSLIYFNRAVMLSANSKDLDKFSYIANQGIGTVYYDKGDYDEALIYYDKAIAELPQALQKDYIALALNNKGRVFKRSGMLEKAQQSFIEALKYADLNEDNNMRAIILTNLGIINRGLNQHQKALSYYDQALEYLIMLNDSYGIGNIYQNKANLYSDLQEQRQALKYNFLAKEIIEKTNYKSINYATLLNNIGLSYCYLNEMDSALIYINQALDLSTIIDDTYGIADTKISLGLVYIEKQNYVVAKTNIREGINIAKKIGAVEVAIGGYQTLIEYELSLNNYKEAFEAQTMFKSLQDSLYNIEKVTAINNLQEKYETEKKEKKIAVQKVELEKNHALIKLYAILLFVIGTGLIAILYLYRKKRSALIKLVEKNKELAQKNQARQAKPGNKNVTEKQQQLYKDFVNRLEKEEIYRDQDLNLEKLAKLLQTNRSEMSAVINKLSDTNYASLVNGYRIKHAIRLLSDPVVSKQYSIEGISIESGFKSLSLFFKHFKEQTGLTPKNFVKSN